MSPLVTYFLATEKFFLFKKIFFNLFLLKNIK